MNDPYVILGLSPNASEDEVKKAYKKLAKKYHPDVTGNDPAAAKKMQEVNAAYDAIINKKADYYQQSSGSSSGYGGYSGFGSSYGFGGFSSGYREETDYGEYTNEMKAAVNYINARRYMEALNALSLVPFDKRTGRWYYLSAVAKSYSGDTEGAKEDINTAIFKEPGNYSYQAFKERLNTSRTTYQYYQRSYSPAGNAFTSCCLPTILLNLFCNCCF